MYDFLGNSYHVRCSVRPISVLVLGLYRQVNNLESHYKFSADRDTTSSLRVSTNILSNVVVSHQTTLPYSPLSSIPIPNYVGHYKLLDGLVNTIVNLDNKLHQGGCWIPLQLCL